MCRVEQKLIYILLYFFSAIVLLGNSKNFSPEDSLYNFNKQININLKVMEDFIYENKLEEASKLAEIFGKEYLYFANVSQKAEFYILLGTIEYNSFLYNKAILSFNKSLSLIKDKNAEAKSLLELYINLGNCYWLQGAFYKSLSFYLEAKESIKDDNLSKGIILNNIGLVCAEIGKYKDAISYYEEALYCFGKEKNRPQYAETLGNIGGIYSYQTEYEKAEKYYKEAYELLEKEESKYLLSILYKLSDLYLYINNLEKAKYYLNKSIKINSIVKDTYYRSCNYYIEGSILNQEKKYKQAYQTLLKVLQLEEKMGTINVGTYYLFSEVCSNLGKDKLAFEHYQKYINMKDSIYNIKKTNKINNFKMQYEADKKDLEIANQNREILQIKYLKYSIVFLLFLIIFFVGIFAKRSFYYNKTMSEKNDKLNVVNDTKNQLFKIVAHDLKSPLTAIIGVTNLLQEQYIPLKKKDVIEYISLLNNAVAKTIDFLDNLLNWGMMQTESFSIKMAEMNIHETIENAIVPLRQSAINKEIKIINNVPQNAKVYADSFMLQTIFRNLINNGIKFTHAKGRIEVNFYKSDNYYVVTVEDNGIGMKKKDIENIFDVNRVVSKKGTENEMGTGLGLILCKELIEKNGGKISVQSEIGKGTTFYVNIKKDCGK